jgi:hypothetical protein
MNSAIEISTIADKGGVHRGQAYPARIAKGHHAEIVPGVSITLHGLETNRARPVLFANVFHIGDVAAVGGMNLVYTGVIRKITAKTIEVVEYAGSCNERVYRLSLYKFDSLNWDFDAAKAEKHNAEWMD